MGKWWKTAIRSLDQPKGKPSGLKTPDGFMFRLTHDNEGKDKLEDKYPLNTFVEILLAIIALATTASAILQGIVAIRELLR